MLLASNHCWSLSPLSPLLRYFASATSGIEQFGMNNDNNRIFPREKSIDRNHKLVRHSEQVEKGKKKKRRNSNRTNATPPSRSLTMVEGESRSPVGGPRQHLAAVGSRTRFRGGDPPHTHREVHHAKSLFLPRSIARVVIVRRRCCRRCRRRRVARGTKSCHVGSARASLAIAVTSPCQRRVEIPRFPRRSSDGTHIHR